MAELLHRILTLPNVTLLAVAEAWLLTRLQPVWLPGNVKSFIDYLGFFPLLYLFFHLNVALLFIYSRIIYSHFFSPIRHLPSPTIKGPDRYYWGANGHLGSYFFNLAVSTPNNEEGIAFLRNRLIGDRLLVTGPKALQEILMIRPYDFEKTPKVRVFLRHVLGDGLVVVEGEQHKFQRKHALPAFSFRHIKDLYPMMWDKSITFTEAIESALRENPVPAFQNNDYLGTTEIYSWAGKATLDIIGIAGLGREFNSMKNADDPLVQDYEELLEPSTEKLLFFMAFTFGPQKLVSKLPWKMNTVLKERTASLRRLCRSLVQQKRAAIEKGTDEHFDILSLLIKSGDFSDDDLCDQLLTFLAAGHETTASAFTWATYLLATHPHIQSRLREEVRGALSESPSADTDLASILEHLPILNGVASETLRLYPTVPITIRRAMHSTSLLSHPVPAGTDIILAPWVTNRLPELWGPDADQFKPDRWITDGKVNYSGGVDSNYAFMTFLHGPRQCIGQGFARAELRCLLAAFVRRFEWVLDMKGADVVPGGVVTIKPRNGLSVKIKIVNE